MQESATRENESALKELADREAALSNAKQAVEDFKPKLEAMTESEQAAKTTLQEFESGPFAHFNTFKARGLNNTFAYLCQIGFNCMGCPQVSSEDIIAHSAAAAAWAYYVMWLL